MNTFKLAFARFTNIFFCNRCKICGEITEIDFDFCDECSQLTRIENPRCMNCGYSKSDCLCKNKKNEYKQISSVYYYTGSIVRAIYNFKNNKMPFLAENMAEQMFSVVKEDYAEIEFDAITFVPLRKLKQLKRGFNQSELIANELSKLMGVNVVPMLIKIRYTGVQHHKTAQQRKADVFGSYDVIDKYKYQLDGKTILLVDDVKTTGSTLNECAKMLKIYGASKVLATSFAITKKEKQPQKDNKKI